MTQTVMQRINALVSENRTLKAENEHLRKRLERTAGELETQRLETQRERAQRLALVASVADAVGVA